MTAAVGVTHERQHVLTVQVVEPPYPRDIELLTGHTDRLARVGERALIGDVGATDLHEGGT